MEKSFEIAGAQKESGEDYHAKLLHIINDVSLKVRAIDPEKDKAFFEEIHEKKRLDATKEIQEYEEIRVDVCDSFGVKNDDDHVYIFKGPLETSNQRGLRAFYVLIDSISKEAFYGEGRIDHMTLLAGISKKLYKIDGVSNFEVITKSLETDSLRYLVFKGFVSTKEFQEMSESNRKMLETPIVDETGEKIETPKSWFVTGHNIPDHI